MMARCSPGVIRTQRAISSSVRRQPAHQPVRGSISHIFMQGDFTISPGARMRLSGSAIFHFQDIRTTQEPEAMRSDGQQDQS